MTDSTRSIPPLVIKISCTRWVTGSCWTHPQISIGQSAMLICGCVQQLPVTQRVQEILITRGGMLLVLSVIVYWNVDNDNNVEIESVLFILMTISLNILHQTRCQWLHVWIVFLECQSVIHAVGWWINSCTKVCMLHDTIRQSFYLV